MLLTPLLKTLIYTNMTILYLLKVNMSSMVLSSGTEWFLFCSFYLIAFLNTTHLPFTMGGRDPFRNKLLRERQTVWSPSRKDFFSKDWSYSAPRPSAKGQEIFPLKKITSPPWSCYSLALYYNEYSKYLAALQNVKLHSLTSQFPATHPVF